MFKKAKILRSTLLLNSESTLNLEHATKRLAIIKYLYDTAVEQSLKPEPICLSSILTFHDCIELFLELTAEHVDKGKSGIDFMGYWELLSTRIEGGLAQKEQCRQLNTARVGLKHSGVWPSKLSIDGFRSSAKSFFEENTKKVFGIHFSEISLIELIMNQETKKLLHKAQSSVKEHKIDDALDEVALAFNTLVDEYEESKKDEFGRSPFYFGGSSFAGSQAVKILSLGLDYKRYAKFRLLTPLVQRSNEGKYIIQRSQKGKYTPTESDVEFCINFIVESALIVQEFDYSLQQIAE